MYQTLTVTGAGTFPSTCDGDIYKVVDVLDFDDDRRNPEGVHPAAQRYCEWDKNMNAAKIDKSPPLQRMHDLLKGGQPVSGFVLMMSAPTTGLSARGVRVESQRS